MAFGYNKWLKDRELGKPLLKDKVYEYCDMENADEIGLEGINFWEWNKILKTVNNILELKPHWRYEMLPVLL